MRSPLQQSNHTWRFLLTKGVFVVIGSLIGIRLFYIQVVQHNHYEALAAKQHTLQREVVAERGTIYSSDGSVLATMRNAYLLFATPEYVEDPKGTAEALVEHVPFEEEGCVLNVSWEEQYQNPEADERDKTKKCLHDEDAFDDLIDEKKEILAELFRDHDRLWVPLQKGLSIDVRDVVTDLELPGIHFESQKVRSYPEGDLAAHVLGFVGSNDEGNPTGYFGLEGYFNGELSGTNGLDYYEIDATGKPIPLGVYKPVQPRQGMDIVTTINRELQFFLDNLLAAGVKRYKADFGTYILTRPSTGEVLAMGNYPTFDPGDWLDALGNTSDVARVDVYKNYAISDNYEPGSVLKAMTMAAGLDSGAVDLETTYNDAGPIELQGYTIRTWNDRYSGVISMAEILQLSNNPGAAFVGEKVGLERYLSYVHDFKLGTTTGIHLQGEESGLVRADDTWREINLATASFGQGISVTPLQLVNVMSAIANDGVMMRPYIVSELHDSANGDVITFEPNVYSTPISAKTSQKMRLMLQQVVEKGEFRWFVDREGLSGYPVGGKTGTAQIPVQGGYDPNQTNTTFVGFAPVDDPEFVLLVRLNKPKTSTYSADTAVPLWFQMARELVTYFGIMQSS